MRIGTIQDDSFNGEYWFSQEDLMSRNIIWTPKKKVVIPKQHFQKQLYFLLHFNVIFLSFYFCQCGTVYIIISYYINQNVFFLRISINKNQISNE